MIGVRLGMCTRTLVAMFAMLRDDRYGCVLTTTSCRRWCDGRFGVARSWCMPCRWYHIVVCCDCRTRRCRVLWCCCLHHELRERSIVARSLLEQHATYGWVVLTLLTEALDRLPVFLRASATPAYEV